MTEARCQLAQIDIARMVAPLTDRLTIKCPVSAGDSLPGLTRLPVHHDLEAKCRRRRNRPLHHQESTVGGHVYARATFGRCRYELSKSATGVEKSSAAPAVMRTAIICRDET